MKLIILILFLIIPNTIPKEKITMFPKIVKKIVKKPIIVNSRIAIFIKKHEGLMLKPYYCPGGVLSIAYGHKILPHEKYDSITQYQADSLLILDIDKSRKWVIANTNLKGNQLEAITHFCYALGTGNFYKSNLFKLIKNNEPIDDEIVKWCKIGKKFNKELLKMRQYELKLYKN